MTNEDLQAEILRLRNEKRDLDTKIKCLKLRLRSTGQAAIQLADQPLFAEAEAILESATDIREDFAALKRALARHREISEVLS